MNVIVRESCFIFFNSCLVRQYQMAFFISYEYSNTYLKCCHQKIYFFKIWIIREQFALFRIENEIVLINQMTEIGATIGLLIFLSESRKEEAENLVYCCPRLE